MTTLHHTAALLAAPLEAAAAYAERRSPEPEGLDAWALGLLGRLHDAVPSRWAGQRQVRTAVQRAAGLAGAMSALSDAALRQQVRACSRATLGPRPRVAAAAGRADQAGGAAGLARQGCLAVALAGVREAATRSLGLRPYDVQLMGAALLLRGRLAEMQTGEGKTLTAGLAAALAALAGLPVHVVTVNDYLAERDAATLGPLMRFLGLDVGVVLAGMPPAMRRAQYACAVTYVTGKELVFDYLKDKVTAGTGRNGLQQRLGRWVGSGSSSGNSGNSGALLLRGLHCAIVDEADSIFIDEARTPLILSVQDASGRDADEAATCVQALDFARALRPVRDWTLLQAARELTLTDTGRDRLADLGGQPADASPALAAGWRVRQAREHLVAQALRAVHMYHRDQQYVVKEGKVLIVDEQTGRAMPGRSWEQGLHQLIEVKEGLALSEHVRTVARITYQRFFRRYLRLAGMTGTAREVRGELWRVYGLHTVAVPTHRPGQRQVAPARCLPDAAAKWQAVCDTAAALHAAGRPVLVGTRSVEASQQVAQALAARGVPHRVLNALQDAAEADLVASAGEPGVVTVATNMAGRGTDIALGEGVLAAGGLHVILTEFHESRRVDRQLFGRAARQGDPGSAQALVSLDDELLRHHGGLWRWLIAACPPRWPRLHAAAVALLRRVGQGRTERQHARQRRAAMRHDRQVEASLSFSGRN